MWSKRFICFAKHHVTMLKSPLCVFQLGCCQPLIHLKKEKSLFFCLFVVTLRNQLKQMSQSANAHTQRQIRWCTGNLWYAVLTGFYGGISLDSSQCVPVAQVNSWKHLNIIHHTTPPPPPNPPAASSGSQKKFNWSLTVSCPPWTTSMSLWSKKPEPSLQPHMPPFWKPLPVWRNSGPLKKLMTVWLMWTTVKTPVRHLKYSFIRYLMHILWQHTETSPVCRRYSTATT